MTPLRFFKENIAPKPVPSEFKQPTRQTIPATMAVSKPTSIGSSQKPSSIGFVLEGRHYVARSARQVLEGVFEALTKRDVTILERFAALPKHGRTRRYLARNPDDLYPNRPDLVRDYSIQLTSGWWLSTNHSRATIVRIIEMACDVAHLKYGKDLQVNVGE